MNVAISILLFIVGLINFLPVMGVASADRLAAAYGIDLFGNDLEILLRHRALLFGMLGGFIFYSIVFPVHQGPAMSMAAVSMIGYVVIMLLVGDYNESLYRIMLVDGVGIVCLVLAAVLRYLAPGTA